MNLKKNTLAVSILSALMVTACGGSGGGNGVSPPSVVSEEFEESIVAPSNKS